VIGLRRLPLPSLSLSPAGLLAEQQAFNAQRPGCVHRAVPARCSVLIDLGERSLA
jgi:hypothetical protein